MASFTQVAGAQSCGDPGVECDADGNVIDDSVEIDPVVVEGDPIDDPEYTDPFADFDPLFPEEPCTIDCEDDNSGGGTDNGGNPETRQECVDLDAQRDPSCIFDPKGPTQHNWNSLANSFANNLDLPIPASGMWATANSSFYHGLIASISVNYWFNQTYDSTNDLYWDYVADYCMSEFPIIDNGLFNWAWDRTDCLSRAYRASFTLIPAYSDSAYTLDTLEASLGGDRASFGFTIQHLTAGDPLGNWGFNYFNSVIKVKQCKVWFDLKDELGCE